MKFNEKLMSIRKMKGLSQEELGMELQVSRQTISKWESGQSYPDFQRLVMLSDYFDMTLDELVKDIDVQDVRNKNLTDEKVASIYLDIENVKNKSRKINKNLLLCWCHFAGNSYFRLYSAFVLSRYRMALGKHTITNHLADVELTPFRNFWKGNTGCKG